VGAPVIAHVDTQVHQFNSRIRCHDVGCSGRCGRRHGELELKTLTNTIEITDLGKKEWSQIHGNESKRSSQVIPPCRHRHSSVVHDQGMWVYGGMTDLQSKCDLWRLDFVSKRWSMIRCKLGPGPLHSHVAVKMDTYMLIIGGEKQGVLSDEVWRFHFSSETWERVETRDPKPTARTQLSAVTLTSVPISLLSKPIACDAHGAADADDADARLPANVAADDARRCLKSLVRPYSGYHLVSDDVGDHHPEAVTSTTSTTTSATPWVVSKMSSYSLLSASDDSLAVEEDVVDVDRMGDRLPCMIRASLTSSASSEKDAEGAERLRTSESVHTFSWASTAPAVRWGVPRSMTTMRFNPFDASMASKTSVGGRRQEVETTSDYASEMDVDSSTCSVIGINNPNYEEFHAHRNAFLNDADEDKEDELKDVEDHRGFALALNASLHERPERHHRLPDVLTQLLQLASERHSNVVCPLEEVTSTTTTTTTSTTVPMKMRHEAVVLTFGGREAIQVTAFDRPMSVWMLRL